MLARISDKLKSEVPVGAALKQKLLNTDDAAETDFRGFLFSLYPCEAVFKKNDQKIFGEAI
jgi:hypothetical protein